MPFMVDKTWDEERLKRDRLALLQAEMQAHDVGALYLTDISLRYVCNLRIPGGQVFVPAQGEPITFVQPKDLRWVGQHFADTRLRLQGKRGDEGDRTEMFRPFGWGMVGLMEERGLGGLSFGVENLETGAMLSLQEAGLRLTDAGPLIEQSQTVKTHDEMLILHAIGSQYEYTMRAFRDAIRPGISENELDWVVQRAWFEAGGEEVSQLMVCSGPNMNPWSRWSTQRTLVEGEFAGVDFNGRGAGGLRGDVSRTFLVGDDPTPEQRDLYRRAYDYLLQTADEIRAGRTYRELLDRLPKVDAKYRVQLDDYHIFHGIGMSYAEYPRVDRSTRKLDAVLRPNQVACVESYFGEVGNPSAVKLEQMVLVRDGAPEVLGANIPFDDRFVL